MFKSIHKNKHLYNFTQFVKKMNKKIMFSLEKKIISNLIWPCKAVCTTYKLQNIMVGYTIHGKDLSMHIIWPLTYEYQLVTLLGQIGTHLFDPYLLGFFFTLWMKQKIKQNISLFSFSNK